MISLQMIGQKSFWNGTNKLPILSSVLKDLMVWIGTLKVPQPTLFGFSHILEGNDNKDSPWNHFNITTLDLMGMISQRLKQQGFIVSMAPSQSYLDPSNSLFDRSLLHEPTWKPGFHYHGYNTYAPLLARYGRTLMDPDPQSMVPTYDFISIQLYEGWSRANHELSSTSITVTQYLNTLINNLATGWEVQFGSDPKIRTPTQTISVPPTQLVIGLANGWAGPNRGDKFVLIWPDQIDLKQIDQPPRGFMFWNLKDEGLEVNGRKLVMATELKQMYKKLETETETPPPPKDL